MRLLGYEVTVLLVCLFCYGFLYLRGIPNGWKFALYELAIIQPFLIIPCYVDWRRLRRRK